MNNEITKEDLDNYISFLNYISLGNCNELILNIDYDLLYTVYEKYENCKIQYNPRKPHIKRYGLNLVSIDNEIASYPCLDSLYQYNLDNKCKINETDFKIKNLLWYECKFNVVFEEIEDLIIRSHYIILPPGGYFPVHRDYSGKNISRLLITIKNCNHESFVFILEDRVLPLRNQKSYLINTCLSHYVANLSPNNEDSVFIVINFLVTKKSMSFLYNRMKIK